MDILLSICLGLGLSAACGFRVFVPLLVMSVAARAGHLELSSGFVWVSATPALMTLAVATAMEVAAYYIPWLDNLLDSVATPAAVIAGVVVTASVVTGMDPLLRWALAIIAGGGLAGTVQTLTVGTRLGSTVTTAGIGNAAVSTVELGSSVLVSLLALVVPLAAVVVVGAFLIFSARRLLRRKAPA